MKYAGFGSRFLAGLVDFLVFLPLMYINAWIQAHSYMGAILFTVPYFIIYAAYNIIFLGKWGQTLGKMAMRIKVTHLDGSNVGYRTALLRHSVDLVFALASLIGMIVAMRAAGPGVFTPDITFLQRTTMIVEQLPAFASISQTLSNVWIWSELIVLLFNRKRRAIHDFMAGTVVIHA